MNKNSIFSFIPAFIFSIFIIYSGVAASEPFTVSIEISEHPVLTIKNNTKEVLMLKTNVLSMLNDTVYGFPRKGSIQFLTPDAIPIHLSISDDKGWIYPSLYSSGCSLVSDYSITEIKLDANKIWKGNFKLDQALRLCMTSYGHNTSNRPSLYRIKLPFLLEDNEGKKHQIYAMSNTTPLK